MATPGMAEWLPAARRGSREALGQALEACRVYLQVVAEGELNEDLRAKGGASDLGATDVPRGPTSVREISAATRKTRCSRGSARCC